MYASSYRGPGSPAEGSTADPSDYITIRRTMADSQLPSGRYGVKDLDSQMGNNGGDYTSDTVPDIARVFTMYHLNDTASEQSSSRQSRTDPQTNQWAKFGPQTPPMNDQKSRSDTAFGHVGRDDHFRLPTASPEKSHRNLSPEKRARERTPSYGRNSTYAGMAPSPNRQPSGIGDASPSGHASPQRYDSAPSQDAMPYVPSRTPSTYDASFERATKRGEDDTNITYPCKSKTDYHLNDISNGPFAAYSRSTSISSFSQRSHGLDSPMVGEGFQSQALDLVDEGRSKTIDAARVERWGGPAQLVSRLENELAGQFDGGVIEDLRGSTHVLLPSLELQGQVVPLLATLLPIIQSTLVVLDVHDNLLQRLPEGLCSCHALEEINISGNPIIELPVWVGELVNLRVAILDDCNLRSLSFNLMAAQQLHTICVRRNRLISLPSWLSQLARLETLLIEGNPFVGPWKTLSETIIGSSAIVAREPGTNVQRAVSNANDGVATGSHTPQYQQALSHPHDIHYGDNSTQEDTAEHAKRQLADTEYQKAGTRSSRSLRRMRSANALLSSSSQPIRRPSMHAAKSTGGNVDNGGNGIMPDREGTLPGEEEDAIEELTGDTDGISPSNATSSTSAPKGRKWGFLRKMSMGKMRASSYSNSQTPPPLPDARGRISSAPSQDSIFNGTSVTPPLGRLDISVTQNIYKRDRGKRRSFLPILEGPPLLNVTIPSFTTSPFSVSSLSLHGQSEWSTAGPSTSITESSPSFKTYRSDSSRQESPGTNAVNYQTGLKDIMLYLGDLYDLSLPVPAVSGGAEVIQSDPGTASASISVTSEARSGASSPHIGIGGDTNSIAGNRYPNVQSVGHDRSKGDSFTGPMSPALTDRSGGESQFSPRPLSVAKAAEDITTPAKRYKDDPVVRCGVVKHLIDTERSYVRGLQDLVSIYVRPASQPISKNDSETVIPANERKIVFGGVEGILQFHAQSFLPALEKAADVLLRSKSSLSGESSQRLAVNIANVFKQYHPFMRQYSAYINNFDYALMRLERWTRNIEKAGSNQASSHADGTTSILDVTGPALTAGAITAGLGIASLGSNGLAGKGGHLTSLAGLTVPQRKRIKSFLKQCRKQPRHTQLNLESYLLLPVQRIPRYRMLLEDLARCTPPSHGSFGDPIEDALQEMVSLASTMNEEKRDSESRRKLVKWAQRIRGRFATPLVQPHRRLLLDGNLTITRNVKRSATLVEVPERMLSGDDYRDRTITSAKSIVQVETLAPEVMERPVLVLLMTDMMLLCKDPSHGRDPDCTVELFAVLKLQTKRKPATVINGNGIRLVDNRNILYLSASTGQDANLWVQTINNDFAR